ncbi:MAG: tryptophan-rich sensory protein [Sphingobacteriales bacterium]|nr:MAG: tryptophan-rich sensory protein [Sphingobacteriales bacterium]
MQDHIVPYNHSLESPIENIVRKGNQLKWWQMALISVAVSALGALSGTGSHKKDRKVYDKELKQAPWAPPGWLFAPAWTFNNSFLLSALLSIANKQNSPEKKRLLWLQAGIWAVFFSFNYVYFRKKSPVLAAIWTKVDLFLAIASIMVAFKGDKKEAMKYLPLLAWTGFASSLADYQALKNPDPVLETKPLLN